MTRGASLQHELVHPSASDTGTTLEQLPCSI